MLTTAPQLQQQLTAPHAYVRPTVREIRRPAVEPASVAQMW